MYFKSLLALNNEARLTEDIFNVPVSEYELNKTVKGQVLADTYSIELWFCPSEVFKSPYYNKTMMLVI